MRKVGTFEGLEAIDVSLLSIMGGRFWFFVTILKITTHLPNAQEEREGERERLHLKWGHGLYRKLTMDQSRCFSKQEAS